MYQEIVPFKTFMKIDKLRINKELYGPEYKT